VRCDAWLRRLDTSGRERWEERDQLGSSPPGTAGARLCCIKVSGVLAVLTGAVRRSAGELGE